MSKGGVDTACLSPGATARPSGEAAVVIEFGDRIDPAAQDAVRRLTVALDAAPPPGTIEVVPTYRSVLIAFDPAATTADAIIAALPSVGDSGASGEAREWIVPVCLADAMAEDLFELADALDIEPDAVRARLLANPLRVGMYGFVPGAAYLTGLDPALHVPRRATPRPPIPAGSLIVAVGQAVICPVAMPTGWYVVGRTAARMFDADAGGGRAPVPFAVGDVLHLKGVSTEAFAALADDPAGGVRRR